MTISVIIPTFDRPQYLLSALRSVASQSRVDLINEVIVSENGNLCDSIDVCTLFPELPIVYIKQDQQLSCYKHIAKLASLAVAPYVAWLGDDDMWGRYHLEEGMRCLNDHPNACAYFGQSVVVHNESLGVDRKCQQIFSEELQPFTDKYQEYWLWHQEDVAINCLDRAPLNIWSLIANNQANLQACVDAYVNSDFADFAACDRYFTWRLSYSGDIIIGRNSISLFSRVHPKSEMNRLIGDYASEKTKKLQREYDLRITKKILSEARQSNCDPLPRWKDLYAQAKSLGKLNAVIAPVPSDTLEFLLGYQSKYIALAIKKNLSSIIFVLKLLSPPILIEMYRFKGLRRKR
jgi:hypothetical protein